MLSNLWRHLFQRVSDLGVRTWTYHLWGGSTECATEGDVRSSICEDLTAAVFRGITPISQVNGEMLQSASSDNIREESDLFSISTDFCRSSQLWMCLNIVVFLMLSCNVIRPLQAAHGVCSLVCWCPLKIQKWFLTGGKKPSICSHCVYPVISF